MTDFKTGDKVTVISAGLGMKGRSGLVAGASRYPEWPIDVLFESGVNYGYSADELKLVKTELFEVGDWEWPNKYANFYEYVDADVRLTAKVLGQFPDDKTEAVDHPAHYGGKDNPYEVIKVAEAWGFEKNAYLFNALKYLGRAGKKGSKVEDLKKLVYYVEREIALEESK